jgi:molecular chaperone IbpA
MRTYDFAPLTRSSIGFDRLFDLINHNAQQVTGQEPGFPPYDLLTVAGNKAENGKQEYLHRGISARNFDRHFNLADHVEVTGASYENGLLQIDLVRRVPEAMKPRRIQINGKNEKAGKTG